MKPSKRHSNRKLHNWLVYNICDKFLEKYAQYLSGTLVDLGCGEAPFKSFFLQYADTYIGVDWSSTSHDSQADVISDLNKEILLKSAYADSLISISVMEHLYNPQTFLSEAFRILKPGGNFVLQVPWQWHLHEEPHDYFRYTPHGLKFLFEQAGFENIEIEAQTGFFTTRALKLNYFMDRFAIGPAPLRFMIRAALTPFWTLSQLIAPQLDKLDKNWPAETQGYFLVAKKPWS